VPPLKAGAGVGGGRESPARDKFAERRAGCWLVERRARRARRSLLIAARARLDAKVNRGHGFRVGKNLHQGGVAGACSARRARPTPTVASFIQSLGRAVVAGRGARRACVFAVFEIGMNSRRRNRTAGLRCGAAACRHSSPRSSRCILEFFAGIEAIADAKAEIFTGLEPGGAVVLKPRQFAIRAHCNRRAKKLGVSRIVSFGVPQNPTRGCSICRCIRPVRPCMPISSATRSPTKLGMPGRPHGDEFVSRCSPRRPLAAPIFALGGRCRCSQIEPAAGRGVRRALEVASGEATLIE